MSLKLRGIIEDAGTASLLQQSVLELPHLLQACTCIFLQTVTAFLRAGQGVFNFTHNEMLYVIKAKFSTTGFNLIGRGTGHRHVIYIPPPSCWTLAQ
jgi:hypothetical protein